MELNHKLYDLSQKCLKGGVIEPDSELYEFVLLNSCNLNNSNALFELGKIYYEKNKINDSISYFKKSHELGNIHSSTFLGKIYSNYDMHKKYLSDISDMPNLMDLPQYHNKASYTFDLTDRNNMSRENITLFNQ